MTGPEHYREAEKILERHPSVLDGEGAEMTAVFAIAQVHATLAVTAAVIAAATMTAADRHEWLKATDPEYAAGCAAEVTR